ncbi:MAG: arsenate reductase (glutaredoxin) [Gammaproteobacteria bacterium]|nr:arsenate reductase (glutaredoxin) [Gammaproteobacteria bacterium]
MTITIYHNPRCSKSRKTLEILRENGAEPVIVEYLKNPPTAASIVHLSRLLGVSVAELLRQHETEFRDAKDLPPLDDDSALAAWVEDHPKVLQRPIVVNEETRQAVIGRPPENALQLLQR